jgi:hypothetical protein
LTFSRQATVDNVNSYGTVDNVVFTFLKTLLSGPELNLFKAAIAALKRPQNKRPLQIYNTSTHNTKLANFLLGSCR